jgi:hypothetical protein
MTTDRPFERTARLSNAQFGLRTLFTLVTVIAFATILSRSNLSAVFADGRANPPAHLTGLMLFAGLWAVIFLTSGGVTYAKSNWMLKAALTLLAVVAAVFFLINANVVARIVASV